ncbi:hypothetical protein RND81_13G110600 [Saponaria officinalis]|uniref:Uncharacterized protein n=1 Tax=Saponaria officinalis TaxID=3572 RepID=A0AAW1GW88_SAPOF
MEPRSAAENDAIKVDEHSIPDDRLRSPSISSISSAKSASSDFSFDDPYQSDVNEQGSFVLDNDHPELSSNPTSNNAPGTPGGTSTLETPPVQVMERPPDASGYRIPSYVFASNKSGNPNPEWSTASNESLFSIHTGNMSFTRDQFSWLLKSGELGTYGGPGDIRKSGELPPPSPKLTIKSGEQKPVDVRKSGEQMAPVTPNTKKSGEQIIANHFKPSSTSPPVADRPDDAGTISPSKVNEAGGVPDSSVGNQKDDPKLEVKVKKKDKSSVSDELPPTSVSHHSTASGQSFAFPVLAEIERDKSVNSGHSRTEQKNTPTPEQDAPKTPTSAPSAATSTTSWFSYLSCCRR